MSADVHMFIADQLHRRGIDDRDRFASRATEALQNLSHWEKTSIHAVLGKIKTDLYRRNPSRLRDTILDLVASRLVQNWKEYPLANTNRSPSTIKVLFISANPVKVVGELSNGTAVTTAPLGLDDELREIKAKVRASKYRDAVKFVQCPAARASDLIQAFNETRPNIVHFSGHGSDTNELILLDAAGKTFRVPKAAIENLFETMKDDIRVVFLNACYSRGIASAIRKHIDCTIGMIEAVPDDTAIVFAAAFYGALGFGRSVREAFDQGVAELRLQGIEGVQIPKLMSRRGVDPKTVKLVG